MSDFENQRVDRLRKAFGTLPNRTPNKKTNVFYGNEILKIDLIDMPKNIYKGIFAMATATWGDDDYERKWDIVSPFDRYVVVKSALTGKTLPTALEAPSFTFQVTGTPRHCFDQMARTRIGTGFGSIGCRDNSKIDSSMILYSEYKNMDMQIRLEVDDLFTEMKNLYEDIINTGKESWQVARSILPMCYHHPFVFTQNLLALLSQARRRMCFGEEEFICGIHWKIANIFREMGLVLIANAMRPACDFAGKCLYSKGDGSELFGNLFAGCGRHKANSDYAEFNKSCTDADNMSNQLGFDTTGPNEFINFTDDLDGYQLLGSRDVMYFEEN